MRQRSAKFITAIALLTMTLATASTGQVKAAEPERSTLELTAQAGSSDHAILDWILSNSGPLHREATRNGIRVAFTLTPAEGWWDKAGGGKLAWHEAPVGAVHLRIFVADANGRMVNNAVLRVLLSDANGNLQSVPADFGWYPLMNAYGANLLLEPGSYRVQVVLERRGEQGIDEPVTFDFDPLEISPAALKGVPLATAAASSSEASLLRASSEAQADLIRRLWGNAAAGLEKAFGDYYVSFALGDDSLFGQKHERLHLPGGESEMQLAVLVRDARTGRLLPGLHISASVSDAQGRFHSPKGLVLGSRMALDVYSGRLRLARGEGYKVQVHLEAPGFRRWGRASERFASAADVEFDGVSTRKP